MNFNFLQDIVSMEFDRSLRGAQSVGNQFVWFALRQQQEYFVLTFG